MFPFPNFMGNSSFQSQLDSSLVRSGPRSLTYAESNKYAIKQQLLQAHEDTRYANLKIKELDHRVGAGRCDPLTLLIVHALSEATTSSFMENGQFNIPVEVVLPPDFPVTAPEVYVRPTATMIVAPNHPFVEASSGAVNTPSIVTWTYPRSNLTSCLTELSAEFGTQSPVYARPAGSAQPTPAQTPNVASFPVPNPYATTGQQPAQPTNAPARTAFGNDPYSPNPTNPAAVQNPYGTDSSNPYMTNPLRPNANSNPPARPANPSMFPGYPPAASGAGGGTYAPSNPYISARPGGTGATPGPAATFPYGSNTAALVAGQAAAGGAPNPPPPDKTSSLSEFRRAAIQSLSERLSRSIEQSEHLIDEETEKLLQQTRQVEENRKVISDACSEKKAELRSLEHNVTALSSATQALHGWLNVNEAKIASLPENVSPSDVIVPVDDLSKQSIAAQAEDMAIEECLELLQEALKGRAAGLEVVMRLGRELAQQQFYCRAVGAKLQQKQRERHSAGTQSNQAYPQAGVLLPMGDAWSRVSTYQY